MSSRPAASIAPVFPAETTASARPVADGAAGGDERAVRLRANRVGRLLVHRDLLRRRRRARGPAYRDRPGRRGRARCRPRGFERARDDLLGAAVAAEGVDRDPDGGHAGYGAGDAERLDVAAAVRLARRAHAVRPLRLVAASGTRSRSALRCRAVARRLSRRDFDVFRFGTAIAQRPTIARIYSSTVLVAANRSRKRRSWVTSRTVPS